MIRITGPTQQRPKSKPKPRAMRPTGRGPIPARHSKTRDRIMRYIEIAATVSEPCPTNAALVRLFGGSPGSVVRHMQRMEEDGLIRVFRGQTSRIVEIVATGARTAGDPGKLLPHWRNKGGV